MTSQTTILFCVCIIPAQTIRIFPHGVPDEPVMSSTGNSYSSQTWQSGPSPNATTISHCVVGSSTSLQAYWVQSKLQEAFLNSLSSSSGSDTFFKCLQTCALNDGLEETSLLEHGLQQKWVHTHVNSKSHEHASYLAVRKNTRPNKLLQVLGISGRRALKSPFWEQGHYSAQCTEELIPSSLLILQG